ncbi:MAG: glycosyltransferase family 39 protein [Candidatus Omnitrophota bacterium]
MSFSAAKIKPFVPLGILVFLVGFYFLNNIAWLALNSVPPYNDSAHHLTNYRVILHSLDGSLSAQQMGDYKERFLYAPLYYFLPVLAALFFGDADYLYIPFNLLFYVILLVAVYASGKKLFGVREGITACLILSIYPYIYGSTRIFVIEGALCSLAALCVCFLLYSEELRKTRFTVAAALVCLLGMLTKQSFLIYVAGPLAFTIAKAAFRRDAFKKVILLVCVGVVLPAILSFNPGTITLFKNHFNDAQLYAPGNPWTRAFYYVLLLPDQINMLSLVVFIAGLAGYVFTKTKDRAFVLVWLLTPLIILTCAPLKSSKYSLPLLAVIALISSGGLYAIVKKPVVRYACLSVILGFGVFVHYALLWDIRLPVNPLTGKGMRLDLAPYLEYAHKPKNNHLDKVQGELFKVLRAACPSGGIHHVGITGHDLYPNGLITPATFRFTDNFIVVNEWGMKSYILQHQLPLMVRTLKKIPDYDASDGVLQCDLLVTVLPLEEFYPEACLFYDLAATLVVPSDKSRIYVYSKKRPRFDKVYEEIFRALQAHIIPNRIYHIGNTGFFAFPKEQMNPSEFERADNFVIVNEPGMKSFISRRQLPLTVRTLGNKPDYYASEGISDCDFLVMALPLSEFYPQVSRFYDRMATLVVPSDGSKIYIYAKNKKPGSAAAVESQWIKEASGDVRMQRAQAAFREGRYGVSTKLLEEFLAGKEARGHTYATACVGLASSYVELMVRDATVSKDCFSKAEHYFNEALKAMDASDPLASAAYSGLGYLYLSKRSYGRALSYLNQGLADYSKEDRLKEYGDLLTNIGYCYLGMKDPAKAKEYFTKAITAFSDADYETLKGALAGLELCSPDPNASKIGE